MSELTAILEGQVRLSNFLHLADPARTRGQNKEVFGSRGGTYNVYTFTETEDENNACCFLVLVHEKQAREWHFPANKLQFNCKVESQSGIFGVYSDQDYPRRYRGTLVETPFFKKSIAVANKQRSYKRSVVVKTPLFTEGAVNVYTKGGKNPYMYVLDFGRYPDWGVEEIKEMLLANCKEMPYRPAVEQRAPEMPTFSYFTKEKVANGTCPAGFISYHNFLNLQKAPSGKYAKGKVIYRAPLSESLLEYYQLEQVQ